MKRQNSLETPTSLNITKEAASYREERLEDVFQDEILNAFTNITGFKMFARSGRGLCLDEHVIEDIVEDHECNVVEQKLKMLNMWKEKYGEQATILNIRNLVASYKKGDDPEDYISLDGGRLGLYKNQPLCERGHVYFGVQKSEITGSYFCAIKLQPKNKNNLREAQILSKLRNHVNVVSILHAGIYRSGLFDYIFIAMDLSWTKTVRNMLEESDRLGIPFNEFISTNLVRQISKAVDFIHSNNIIHRDLKPENVLLSEDWSQSKVTDFEFSKSYFSGFPTNQTNVNIGTDGYRSAETYNIDVKITSTSDIFSLGVVIAEILANGTHPFGKDQYLWSHNIINNNNLDLSHLLVSNNAQVIGLIKRMLEMDPEKRPTADKVLNEIQQFTGWSQLKNQQTTADQSSATLSMTRLQLPTAEEVRNETQQFETWSQLRNQQTTAEQSSATTSMMQLQITEKANAIIMFNWKDEHLYSYKPTTKEYRKMQKLPRKYIESKSVVSGKHIYVLTNQEMYRQKVYQQKVYRLEYSDPASKWKKMSSMINDQGYSQSAAVLNGSIYVCRGSGIAEASRFVERYDAARDRWERICDMNIERHISCVVATKDHIYCTGGSDDVSVERYDERSNQWEFVEPTPRVVENGSAAVVNNRIYVADDKGVLCYDIQKNSWSEMNLSYQWDFVRLWSVKILAVNEELYIMGVIERDSGLEKTIHLLEPETEQMTLVEENRSKDNTFSTLSCLAVKL